MQKKYSPLKQFSLYWRQALAKEEPNVDYLYLATTDQKKRAHVRTVLIKTVDQKGIGFVTQSLGPKARQMKNGKYVEACINWPKMKMQIRLGGKIAPMPRSILKKLWEKRPRDAQLLYTLGLPQSSPIPSYEYLLRRLGDLAIAWRGKKKIPLSKYYIGFVIEPEMIEFLHHSQARLNLREYFQKTDKGWSKKTLAP